MSDTVASTATSEARRIIVMGEDWTGTADAASLSSDADGLIAVHVAPSGPTIHAPFRLFTRRGGETATEADDTLFLPLRREALTQYADISPEAARLAARGELAPGATLTIPVIEESLRIETERVAVGGVRIVKTVDARDETVDEPLTRDEVTVERVAVGRVIGSPAQVRYEGDVTIIPVMEETLVVEKRITLREELHIRRTTVPFRAPVTVTLRSENVSVTRVGGASNGYDLAEDEENASAGEPA